MNKDEIYALMENMFSDEKVPMKTLFNWFSSQDLEDFYGFLKSEGY